MKWDRLGFWFFKSIFIYLMIYLLLVNFNDRNISDSTELIVYQLLYPFPFLPNEQVNFLRVIMILGLSFTSFSNLFLLMGELSEGGRELIRFHSKDIWDYVVKIGQLLFQYYLVEFTIQLIGIVTVLKAFTNASLDIMSLVYLFTSWFMIDTICFLAAQIWTSSSVILIVALTLICLIRYIIITHVIWLIPMLVMLIILTTYHRKEKYKC